MDDIKGPHQKQLDDRIVDRNFEKSRLIFKGGRLVDYAKEWKFYSPALLYLYGRFKDEMLASHDDTLDGSLVVGHRMFDKPIFSGMTAFDGDMAWNNVLWATPHDQWPALENHILAVLAYDSQSDAAYSYGAQDIRIVDPLQADDGLLSSTICWLDITVLGVASNLGCVAVSTGENPLVLPSVVTHPPAESMVDYVARAKSNQV